MESRLLFICMGNICRSPLAQGIAQGLYNGWSDPILDSSFLPAQKGIPAVFDSAGIHGYHRGEAPCRGSQEIAKQHGLDIASLRSRPVRLQDEERFDYFVAMDSENIQALLKMGFAQEKILRMGDFGDGMDIPDPYYYRDMQGFETIYAMLYPAIKKLLYTQGILR